MKWTKFNDRARFITLLIVYLLWVGIQRVIRRDRTGENMVSPLRKIINYLDKGSTGTISRIDLIDLSIRNMAGKRTRTMITIGGMAVGIAIIVFLVSLGYGLQELVISRVVKLDEMRQTDISVSSGGKLAINDKTLSDLKEINEVETVMPMIGVVGHITYQSSVSDMAVYGVTTDYLNASAIKPSSGKFFESNEVVYSMPYKVSGMGQGEVAGAETAQVGQEIGKVTFSINPESWVRVRKEADSKSELIGYTQRVEGETVGIELWGESYSGDEEAGKWIYSKVLMYDKLSDGTYQPRVDDEGTLVVAEGYLAEINIKIDKPEDIGKVLGTTISSVTTSEGNNLEWVDIASESAIAKTPDIQEVALGEEAVREAVVNSAMLKVLGISENEALGKTFTTSFVVVGDLLEDPSLKLKSVEASYTIVGVTPDSKTPQIYVPFIDLRSIGIVKYSQAKVVVKTTGLLSKVRSQIEAMGYISRSVADTVTQITNLFGTARLILALLGMVALGVAALGMFNTLTVSLLERTREVGLMKAMGMKSGEVQELFLTESMIMGIVGGVGGILGGFILGKLTGLIISIFAVFKGVGYVDISYLPWTFMLTILVLSLVVGLVTGMYPARRATRISALDALRYE